MGRIRRRGNTYQLRTMVDGISKTKSWKIPQGMTPRQAEKQAQKELDKLEELIRRGINIDKITFEEVAIQYIDFITGTLKPTTVKGQYDRIRLLLPFFGKM